MEIDKAFVSGTKRLMKINNSNVCERCGYQSHPVSKRCRRKDGRSLSGPTLAGDRTMDVHNGLV